MLSWSVYVIKYWRYIAVAFAVLGAVSYYAYTLHQAKQAGKQECQNEVIIKQVEVIKDANHARTKAVIDSTKRDIPDSLRKFYID